MYTSFFVQFSILAILVLTVQPIHAHNGEKFGYSSDVIFSTSHPRPIRVIPPRILHQKIWRDGVMTRQERYIRHKNNRNLRLYAERQWLLNQVRIKRGYRSF